MGIRFFIAVDLGPEGNEQLSGCTLLGRSAWPRSGSLDVKELKQAATGCGGNRSR